MALEMTTFNLWSSPLDCKSLEERSQTHSSSIPSTYIIAWHTQVLDIDELLITTSPRVFSFIKLN